MHEGKPWLKLQEESYTPQHRKPGYGEIENK